MLCLSAHAAGIGLSISRGLRDSDWPCFRLDGVLFTQSVWGKMGDGWVDGASGSGGGGVGAVDIGLFRWV